MYRFYFIVLCLALGSCATFEVVELPLRNADLYPLSQTREHVTVAVDVIKTPERTGKYFGYDLTKKGIMAVNITISNHGENSYVIMPSDVLIRKSNEVFDPLPVQTVAEIATNNSWGVSAKTREKIHNYYHNVAYTETILAPRETYQGVLFFKKPVKSKRDRYFSTISLFSNNQLKLQLAITDADDDHRVLYRPFLLSSGHGID